MGTWCRPRTAGGPLRDVAASPSWPRTLLAGALAPAVLVYFEWLFHATKESFLSALGLPGQLAVLASSVAVAALASLAILTPLAVAGSLARARVGRLLHRVAVVLIAATLAALVLLLVDNFTLTVFRTGVRTLGRAGSIVYLLVLVALIVVLTRWLAQRTVQRSAADDRQARIAVAAVAVIAVGVVGATALRRRASHDFRPGAAVRLPNILIVGSDGVDADRMSLYGYAKDTTPFLRSLAPRALVADFAFANATSSAGSITALLTGRLPSSTGVVYPPNILRGDDSYRHLPGLLKGLGYRTLEVSVPHYADANDLNFRRAFDESNGRVSRETASAVVARLAGDDAAYLLGAIRDRVGERALHLACVRAMRDVYAEVTKAPVGEVGDQEMLARLAQFTTAANQPFFAHVHLMGTHGPLFAPRSSEFRRREPQTHDWQREHYDDTVRDFDDHIRDIVATLQERGLLEHTILVVWSDHGTLWRSTSPIPLVFRFPGGEPNGRIAQNVQAADVAPTLLDAMGSAVPEWMDGSSVLHGVDGCRTILSFTSDWDLWRMQGGVWFSGGTGKLGSLGFVQAVQCETTYSFDVRGGAGVSVPLRRQQQPVHRDCGCAASREATGSLVATHVRESGFPLDAAVAAALPVRAGITHGEAAMPFVKAMHGPDFVPPVPEKQRFDDVPLDWPEARWIEQVAADGALPGCQPRLFCPEKPMERVALAATFGRASRWPGADSTAMVDLEIVSWAGGWVNRVVAEGVMAACGPRRFCPSRWVTREEFDHVVDRIRR